MIKFLDLQSQYNSIKSEIDAAIKQVITNSAFIGGENVKTFEKTFAEFHAANYCIAVGNGTDAIEIALEALNLPKGSEVIVPANSFIASSEAVTRSGYKVVFCDCDANNYTISVNSIKEKITSDTKAIIAVHLYGHPCDMDEINQLAKKHDLKVIEDCAQAHVAEYKGKRIGSLGDISTFSFYPGKNLGAYGDAGAILSNNEDLATMCRKIANHGRIGKYDHEFEGRNSRMDGLQAAILNVKLGHIVAWTEKRIAIADYYLKELKDIPEIILPKREDWAKQVYHLFVIRTNDQLKLQNHLKKNGIQTGIHYPICLPKLKAYEYCKQQSEDFVAFDYDSKLLSLPIGEHLNESELIEIVNQIKLYFK